MCYTSFKDFDALCKLLPLQWQIADLSLQLVGPTLCVHPTQCGQTRHVISFLLALHTFPWPAGKSPLVPGLTFQLLCIYLIRGQTLNHPVTFWFWMGLQGRQYLWENLQSLAVPSDTGWSGLPPCHSERSHLAKEHQGPLPHVPVRHSSGVCSVLGMLLTCHCWAVCDRELLTASPFSL